MIDFRYVNPLCGLVMVLAGLVMLTMGYVLLAAPPLAAGLVLVALYRKRLVELMGL